MFKYMVQNKEGKYLWSIGGVISWTDDESRASRYKDMRIPNKLLRLNGIDPKTVKKVEVK